MPDLVTIQRALLSVSDKADLIPFANALVARGVELISTGGTVRNLPGVVTAKNQAKKGAAALAALPRFAQDCK